MQVSGAVSRPPVTLVPLTRSTSGWPGPRNLVRYVHQEFEQQAHGSPTVELTSHSRDNSVMLASCAAPSRRRSRRGADLIKVALAGWNEGARPQGRPEIPFDAKLLSVAVEEAHRANFKIACHANDAASCHIAARAGVDSLEHGMFLEGDDLKAMSDNKTILVPTMSVWDAMLYYAHAVGWPEARKKRAEDLREGSRKAVAQAMEAGVQLALGTDAGGGAARHGRIAREAELMVEAGMKPSQALAAGTAVAAKLIGETERGTVEEGKVADMVLLDADPLENIGGLRLVAAVFQEGRRVA